jgi:hypothetical protein
MIRDQVPALVEDDARILSIPLSEKHQIEEVAGLRLEVRPPRLEPAKQVPDEGRQALGPQTVRRRVGDQPTCRCRPSPPRRVRVS